MSKNTNSVAQSTATRRRSALIVLAGAAVLIAMILAVVTRSSNNATGARHHGVVDVLYAGSLSDLMQLQIATAFHRATGYTVQGFSGGSTALATEIKNGIEVGDVFLSASAKADAALAGSANGSWVSSYTQFGTSKLLLAYNPDSSFALALRSTPWYEVVDRGGFHLGRTDPLTDPKGVLAVSALKTAASKYHRGDLAALATSRSNVFAETSLVGELQAGQLDAGFFYAVEATAANLKTVPLSGTDLAAKYTIAELKQAPHDAAAREFIAFLLSSTGREILNLNGVVTTVPVTVHSFG